MSIFKNNLRLLGSSIQSGGHSTTLKVGRLVCAALIAGFIFVCGSAKAYTTNVLVNPGAETGDLTGWNVSLTGYIYVVSTNGTIPGSGTSNFLAHSGSHTFQLFNTTATTSSMYQDYAAIAGSLWSPSCYAICYASNYFQPEANAHMQVAFYDVSNNVLPSASSPSGTGGVYVSAFLDPVDLSGLGVPSIIPPPAVDASGWLNLLATNLNTSDPATEATYEIPLSPIPTTLTAPAGTAKIRYFIAFDNAGTDGGDVYFDDCALNKLNLTDPDITNPPVAVTVYAGSPATFTVGAWHTGAHPGEKLTYQWQYNGTNLPAAGGVNDISGTTTTPSLSFINLQGADSGLYSVFVTVKSTGGSSDGYSNSILSVPVPLTVLTLSPLQKANVLGSNAGFEGNPAWPLWEPFNGAYFDTTNNFYDAAATIPVNVLDGTSVALIGANGDRDNGIHHAFSATPGSLWKAGGWVYLPSSNDFYDGNTCRIQIWFRDANGNTVAGTPTFESFKLYGLGYTNTDAQYTNIDTSSSNFGQVGNHAQLPRDQWVFLPVTNIVNNGGIGIGDDLPYNTWSNGYFVVPTNSTVAQINFQVYEYCPVAADNPQADLTGNAADATYWDDMQLIQVLPVTDLKASVGGGNVTLSFSAGAGLNYAVLYKTNLSDATWNVLANNIAAPLSWQTNITSVGTTYPVTVSDTRTSRSRFYRVQSQ